MGNSEKVNQDTVILVVDDLPENAKVLAGFLSPQGYSVHAAYTGEDALAFVNGTPPDLILLDLVMPGLNGFEVCRQLKDDANARHIPIIIITGLTDREANIRAVEAGADDFLVKPFDRVLLEARIRSSLKTKRLQDQILHHQRDLEERVQERTRELQIAQQVTVFSLSKLAESRDNETGDHIDRMRQYTRILADELSRDPALEDEIFPGYVQQIFDSSPLHDIGKVGIPDSILLKPGRLTGEEFDIMKTHTLIGGDTLRAADREARNNQFLSMGRDIAYYHHEKWDGSGYPFGLSGAEIPLCARIAALADVYDALSSKRPYKEAFSHEKAKGIIDEGNGSHFDPRIVQAFHAREGEFVNIRNTVQGEGGLSPLEQLLAKAHTQAAV